MGGGFGLSAASLWAEGFAPCKQSVLQCPNRPHHLPPRPTPAPRFLDHPVRDVRASRMAKKHHSVGLTIKPLLPSHPVDAPSPFAPNNYRDPLLTPVPEITIKLPVLAPLSPSLVDTPLQSITHKHLHAPPHMPVERVVNEPTVDHSRHESVVKSTHLHDVSMLSPSRHLRGSESKPICRIFLRNGCCPYGNLCKFIHVAKISEATVDVLEDPPAVPLAPATDSQLGEKRCNQHTPDSGSAPSESQIASPAPIVKLSNQNRSFSCPNPEIKPLPSTSVLENACAYVVKLPPQRFELNQGAQRSAPTRKVRRTIENSLGTVEISSGHFDLFLFGIPSKDSGPVVKLPFSGRRTTNQYQEKKNHTANRHAPQRWDPCPSTEPNSEEDYGQVSESGDDSLSDDFSNLSMASSHTSFGLGQEAFSLTDDRMEAIHHDSSQKPHAGLSTGVPLGGRRQPIGSLYDDYLANAPEKPPGLEHIRPTPPGSHSVPEQRQTSGSHANAGQLWKPTGNLVVTISDHSKVKFGPGFEVLALTTGFESRWILVRNLPAGIKTEEVNRLLEPFGRVTELRHFEGASTAKAEFAELSEAVQAAAALNGAVVFDSTINASVSIGSSAFSKCKVQDSTVLLTWEPPGRVGYAGYSTLSDAEAAIAAAADEPLRGCFIAASVHRGLPSIDAYTVRFHGLPSDAVAEDVKRFGHTEDVMLERPSYTNRDTPLRVIRQILDGFGDYTIEIVQPSSRDRLFRAWFTFSSPQIAAAATECLSGQRLSLLQRCKFRAHHTKTVTYMVAQQSFLKIRHDLITLRDSCSKRFGPGTGLKFSARRGIYQRIQASGESLSDLCSLKADVEAIIYGEVIREDGKPVWDRFFGQFVGKAYLESLTRDHPSTFVRPDVARRFIIVVGSFAGRQIVRERILRKVAELKRQKIRSISLAGGIIGYFVSADLHTLQERLGLENVVLSLGERVLKIRGNDQALEMAQEAVRRAEQNQGKKERRATSECPVCFSEDATSPVTLKCGHAWCKACLSGYLVAATDNKLFPLTCLGSEATCPELIPITTAREILPGGEFDALVNASFAAYVHARPEQFYYCPTPDCPQVYRAATQSTVLQCPACLIRICPVCHVEYHDGFECAGGAANNNNGGGSGSGGEQQFWEWSREHDVKPCPGCKAPIERSEGCNHMTCTRCHTHTCWACMKTFPKGQGVYDHMRVVHGGIGL